MIDMNLQYFGGRGSSGSRSGGGDKAITFREASNLPLGSIISVEEFSGITGKPTGNTIDYTLHARTLAGSTKAEKVWESQGHGTFENNETAFVQHNRSINGVIPKTTLKREGLIDEIRIGNKTYDAQTGKEIRRKRK